MGVLAPGCSLHGDGAGCGCPQPPKQLFPEKALVGIGKRNPSTGRGPNEGVWGGLADCILHPDRMDEQGGGRMAPHTRFPPSSPSLQVGALIRQRCPSSVPGDSSGAQAWACGTVLSVTVLPCLSVLTEAIHGHGDAPTPRHLRDLRPQDLLGHVGSTRDPAQGPEREHREESFTLQPRVQLPAPAVVPVAWRDTSVRSQYGVNQCGPQTRKLKGSSMLDRGPHHWQNPSYF